MKRALVLLAACGDRHVAPEIDAPPPPACTATYTGNVTEIATSDTPCTALAGTMLTASIPSHALDAPLALAIDLGTTATGGFTSATVPSWSADGVRTAAHEPCTYSGGSAVSPHGDFTLSLDAGPHGTLTAHTYVLAAAFTDCGDPDTQTVVLAF